MWEEYMSWNCRHKSLLTSRRNTSPYTIGQMPLEGLAKAKSLVAPKMWAMDYEMWPMATWELNWWCWMKPVTKSLRLKQFWKCSKIMLNELHVNIWDMPKQVDLKECIESSTSMFNWKSIKESKQGESEFERCRAYNA
jgi:hypothetical protein